MSAPMLDHVWHAPARAVPVPTHGELITAVAEALHAVQATPSGWVMTLGSELVDGQILLTVTTWRPLQQGGHSHRVTYPVQLGEALP